MRAAGGWMSCSDRFDSSIDGQFREVYCVLAESGACLSNVRHELHLVGGWVCGTTQVSECDSHTWV